MTRESVKKILKLLGLYLPTVQFFNFVLSALHGRGRKNGNRKRKFLRKIIKQFNYRVFIETGTYKGEMIDNVKNRFDKIYSIELGEDLFKKAKEKFVGEPKIKLYQGDSALILPTILKDVNEPAFFWLDAHYSKNDTARAENSDTPIENELRAVFNHHINKHVIMIDDALDFGHGDYPSIDSVKALANNFNYAVKEIKYSDGLLITPK